MARGRDPAAYDALLDDLCARGEPAVAALDGSLRAMVDWLWDRGWTAVLCLVLGGGAQTSPR